jgi:hypothetical protein
LANQFLCWLGKAFPIGLALILTYTFYLAFFNPSQSVIIYVNRYNEALIEAIVLFIVWGIIIYERFPRAPSKVL